MIKKPKMKPVYWAVRPKNAPHLVRITSKKYDNVGDALEDTVGTRLLGSLEVKRLTTRKADLMSGKKRIAMLEDWRGWE